MPSNSKPESTKPAADLPSPPTLSKQNPNEQPIDFDGVEGVTAFYLATGDGQIVFI